MSKMRLPAAPGVRTTVYGNFRGVDFSVDPSLVDKRRSPYAPNMISDDGGSPVKRPGWRVLQQLPGRINGLFFAELGGREYILCHAGTTLQVVEGDTVKEVYTGIADARSCAFYMPSTGEPSRIIDSRKESVTYPKTLSLNPGKYSIEMTGGKGRDQLDFYDKNISGGKGGKISFDLELPDNAEVTLKSISNNTGHGTSIQMLINGTLYAATGGGGNASGNVSGDDNGLHYYAEGGNGGGKSGAPGRSGDGYLTAPAGGTQTAGGLGSRRSSVPVDRYETIVTVKNGNDGAAYPDSTGGSGLAGEDDLSASGGCGYMGGGAGGYIDYKRKKNHNTTTYWAGGSGAGGSSYLKESDDIFKVEDSQGTNNGSAYIAINRKADELQQLYILTGQEYLVFNGETVKNMQAEAYVPKVIISRKPAGGGQIYEAVNLMTPKRTESFLGDNINTGYQLTATNLDETPVTVKIVNKAGDYDEMTEGNGFTVNRLTGKVTFSSVHNPVVTGQDNVLITYSKMVSGYSDKISKCTIGTTYGVGGNNRVFVSGNPEFKAYDYWSDIYKPGYFPDLNYSVVGVNNTAIMGYQKIGEYLSVIKEDNQQDITIFLRSGYLNDAGEAMFSLKPGIAGIGAVSRRCFVNLGDEPLFLARMGIYATTSTLLSSERVTKNRSYFIDKKLKAEPNLEDAVACEWNGYYLLAVNGNVYILDSRHKSGERNGNTDFVYECYHWTNVPVSSWLSLNGELYFGTDDGRLCKFNTDELPNAKMTIYSDGGRLGEDGRITGGRAIDSAWFTPNDDDGAVYLFKTLQKKGSLVTISPYDRSSAEICFSMDGNPEEFVKKENMDIFDWEDIDFERFTFNSNTSPQEVYFRKRKKKYKRLQIGIRNRQIDEGFGVSQIVKCFTIGNYSKNRGY